VKTIQKLKNKNLGKTMPRRKIVDIDVILDLMNKGWSQKKIAEYFKVGNSTISMCIKRHQKKVKSNKKLQELAKQSTLKSEITQQSSQFDNLEIESIRENRTTADGKQLTISYKKPEGSKSSSKLQTIIDKQTEDIDLFLDKCLMPFLAEEPQWVDYFNNWIDKNL